jgi:hypothetical protein
LVGKNEKLEHLIQRQQEELNKADHGSVDHG